MLYLLLLSLVIHTVMFTLTRSLFISPSRLLFKSFGSRKKGQYSGPLHYSRDGQQQQKQQQQIPTSSPSEPKLAKRKVALVFSYVGTMYNGLQMDSQQLSMGFVAVEAVIERELHNLKYIKDSNHLDLAKIGWSRSSRTDKGVHCTRIVLSAKLEFNPSDLPNDNDPPFIHSIVEQMNERLPSDIRMVSCFRVTGSFRARHNCVWREYEYLLPINGILTNLNAISTGVDMEKSAVTKEQLIARLNKYLRRFEGENSLHNFHRTARRDLRTRRPSFASNLFSDTDIDIDTSSTSKQYKSESDQSVSDPIDSSAEDADADDGMLESLDSTLGSGEESSLNTDSIPGDSQKESGSENILITNQYERWYPIPRDMIPKTQGTIYVCEVRDVVVVDGVELVRICVRGQSFLLQ